MSNIVIHTPDGSFNAYLARPKRNLAPAVVVLQEILGFNADLRATCDELATQGYLAIGPDLFWRQQPGVELTDRSDDEWNKGFALYGAFDYSAGFADVLRTLEVARTLDGASGMVGLMGFCLGGLMTFLTTARDGVVASVIYYGGGTEKHLEEAQDIENPLLMHLGEADEYIPPEAREAIIASLNEVSAARVYTYPGCRHAFARHAGAHYDQAAAALANCRTQDFLRFHLHLGGFTRPMS